MDEPRTPVTIEDALYLAPLPQTNHPKCPPLPLINIEERQLRELLGFFGFVMTFDEFVDKLREVRDRYNYAFLTAMDDEDFADIRHSHLEMVEDLSFIDHVIRLK
jgi:hypothetical protein